MTLTPPALPPEITVLERGWLSANNYLFTGASGGAALVDSGYCSHSAQTLALVQSALAGAPLARLLNTHLHSDHCGGNAVLQAAWPQLQTLIPPGQAQAVADWDMAALSYAATGQDCPRFGYDATLAPGSTIDLGGRSWQIHAAPGHDPHAVLLFEPRDGLLLSGDALWEHGFGVVFPELEGEDAFAAVGATLELIAQLEPRTVLPGHGPVFGDLPGALARAHRRLQRFTDDPLQHAEHAAKVLLKFKLLQHGQLSEAALQQWAAATPYLDSVRARHFPQHSLQTWLHSLVTALVRSGAAQRLGDGMVSN
jgi:glyoxylase-like metal-dependent hydrolase (beta-lactamase superfamily II)